jgi:NAD(P)-dependent dehydrogenase (short-subunit alcohol dehydrogenase family)
MVDAVMTAHGRLDVTPMFEAFGADEQTRAAMAAMHPVGRLGRPDDVARGGDVPSRSPKLIRHRHHACRRRRVAGAVTIWRR